MGKITTAQKNFLETMFGPEGYNYESILESGVSLGLEIQFIIELMQSAVTKPHWIFSQYINELRDKRSSISPFHFEQLEDALLTLNSLASNRFIVYKKPSLDYYFDRLGVVYPRKLQCTLCSMIEDRIKALTENLPKALEIKHQKLFPYDFLNGTMTPEWYNQLSEQVKQLIDDYPDEVHALVIDWQAELSKLPRLSEIELENVNALIDFGKKTRVSFDTYIELNSSVRNWVIQNLEASQKFVGLWHPELRAIKQLTHVERRNIDRLIDFALNTDLDFDTYIRFDPSTRYIIATEPDKLLQIQRCMDGSIADFLNLDWGKKMLMFNHIPALFQLRDDGVYGDQLMDLSYDALKTVLGDPQGAEAQQLWKPLRSVRGMVTAKCNIL